MTSSSVQTDAIRIVANTLEHYAHRGVFRGFSKVSERGDKALFRMVWHHDHKFDCMFDPATATMRFPALLPQVPAGSEMDKAFREYVKSRQSANLPDHRRIDPARAKLTVANRAGTISLSLKVLDGGYEYGVRKLVNLVHEIFLDFLYDGRYFQYLVDVFGLDPDRY